MNIEMPSREERSRSIRLIIDTTLEKRTFCGEIKRLLTTVGLRRAFMGVGDALAAAVMVSFGTLLVISVLTVTVRNNGNAGRILVFIPILFFSPILYFTMLAFTSWKERMAGTWEVLTACRYNLRYITALREMIVTSAGIIFIPLAILPLAASSEYPRILIAALCAQFLYGALTLFILLISESRGFYAPLLWTAAWGLFLLILSPVQAERLIANVPPVFIAILLCVFLILYLVEMRLLIMRTAKRRLPNVIS